MMGFFMVIIEVSLMALGIVAVLRIIDRTLTRRRTRKAAPPMPDSIPTKAETITEGDVLLVDGRTWTVVRPPVHGQQVDLIFICDEGAMSADYGQLIERVEQT